MPEDRILTHYEAYFADAGTELRRVLDFLEIRASSETIIQSTKVVSKKLRRQNASLIPLSEKDLGGPVSDLYMAVCAEAGHPLTSSAAGID